MPACRFAYILRAPRTSIAVHQLYRQAATTAVLVTLRQRRRLKPSLR